MTDALSDAVADAFRTRRRELGLNLQRLAARCADLGLPKLTSAALTNIETGRRSRDGVRRRYVTIDELVCIATALDMPEPLDLITQGSAVSQGPTTSRVVQLIKKLRVQRGWTAEDLAEHMTANGIKWQVGVIAKLETQRRAVLSVDELVALATVFGLEPADLLAEPPCGQCNGLPPVGFSCNACGRGDT